ncbi:MAG: shikimate kinase [Isosphaeraceae bacterium]
MNEARPARDPHSLALVGYRGTGKSTVGRILASRLGWTFHDTDTLLELTNPLPVALMFRQFGEPTFRDLESAIFSGLVEGPPRVVATGGGIVVRPENRRRLRSFGLVVWLTADPGRIAGRIAEEAHLRPALTAAGTLGEIAEVLEQRTPWYAEVADVAIATDDLTPEEVAEAILEARGDRPC